MEPKHDQIDEAIAAAAAAPADDRVNVAVTIASSGRQVDIRLPMDLSHTEMLEVLGWMATSLRKATDDVRAAQGAGPQLVVARALPA